jgi:hypothetical protein
MLFINLLGCKNNLFDVMMKGFFNLVVGNTGGSNRSPYSKIYLEIPFLRVAVEKFAMFAAANRLN